MKLFTRSLVTGLALAATTILLSRCGSESVDTPPPAGNPGSQPLSEIIGAFAVDCPGQSSQQQQQKQIPFQKQQQSGCNQQFQFQQSRLSDYLVTIDCDQRLVRFDNKATDRKVVEAAIQDDGTVSASLQYQQPVQSDGRGNNMCWVQYNVRFDGKASCPARPEQGGTAPFPVPMPSTDPSASPMPMPSGSPMPSASPSPEVGTLSVTTQVEFQSTTEQAVRDVLEQAGQAPEPTPSPEPTFTILPSPMPSGSPSASPSPTATPTGTPSPMPSVTATVTPIVTCLVDNPCAVTGKADLGCAPQQQAGTTSGSGGDDLYR